MSRLQKIFLIIGFFLVVFAMGYLLYALFFKPFIPSENTNESSNANSTLPQANGNTNIRIYTNTNGILPSSGDINGNTNANAPLGGINGSESITTQTVPIESITTQTIEGAAISQDGKSIYYYDTQSDKFYIAGKDGQIKPLSDKVFHEVDNVIWSPQKDKAVLEYPDGSNIVYDFTTKTQITLPAHWEDFGFSQDGSKIISKNISLDSENNFLIITDSTGTKTKIVQRLGTNGDKVIPAWSPNNQMIAFFVGDSGIDQQEIFFIGQNNENFKSMIVEGWGFQGKWTPQGDKVLYSVYSTASQNKPELWVVDASVNSIGRNREPIQLQTWADKCTFYDNSTVYCAVPNSLQEGAGLLPSETDNSADTIYKININTGAKTEIAVPNQDHTMENLIISSDGKEMYFTDKTDGKLYKISLQ